MTQTYNTIGIEKKRSLAVTGESGNGKTVLLQWLASQMGYTDGTAVVAHDLDEDFQDLLGRLGLDVVRLDVEDADANWNLFLDVEKERRYGEIASAIMGKRNPRNPFHGPATDVLEAILIYLHRQAIEQGDYPDHADLRDMLNLPLERLYQTLSQNDLEADASHIDPDSGKSARNTYQTLREKTKKVLVGDFAGAGAFSLREYFENPNGRALVVDSDPMELDTLGPMFRLILDMSIRFAMDSETPANLILDEIDALPPIPKLGMLASKGRSRGARCLIGIQQVGQLVDTYGEKGAKSEILGNCPQGVHFSPGDAETVEFIKNEVGERMMPDTSSSSSQSQRGYFGKRTHSASSSTRARERNPITAGMLNDFGTGDAVIITPEGWYVGHIKEFDPERVTPAVKGGAD